MEKIIANNGKKPEIPPKQSTHGWQAKEIPLGIGSSKAFEGPTIRKSIVEHAKEVPAEKDHEQTQVTNDTVKAINSDEQADSIAHEENNA